VEDGTLKFIIVKSVVPEPGLLGSATGLLDDEQLSRLRAMVKSTSSRQVVILMHHAISRWQENQSDARGTLVALQRWGLLSHDGKESQAIVGILEKEASCVVESILLCVGHWHDVARAGPVLIETSLARCQWSTRLQILESPSLPRVELQGSLTSARTYVLACRRLSGGRLVPYRTALTASTCRSQFNKSALRARRSTRLCITERDPNIRHEPQALAMRLHTS
jgi:hypothetical protein